MTLGDWLGDLGYDTAAIGKMHFNSPVAARVPRADRPRRTGKPGSPRTPRRAATTGAPGGPSATRPPSGSTPTAGPPACRPRRWIRPTSPTGPSTTSATTATTPFALVVGFYDPHSPFRFPDEWAGRFRPESFPVPPVSAADLRDQPLVFRDLTGRDAQGIQAAYYTSLSFLDHQVGRVLDALDALGLADDTVVVFLGDNGYMLGEHGRFEKHCFYEPAVRVPLLVRWKGHLPAGRRVDGMVELVDLFPTVLDLLGVAAPGPHGRSLVPLLKGEPGATGPRRGLQRVPGKRGGDGPRRAVQARRRHRPPQAARRLRDRHPLPGPTSASTTSRPTRTRRPTLPTAPNSRP